MIITSGLLLVVSVVVAGVGVARTRSLPRAAGIGFAASMVLFALANIPDTGPWQAIAGALMTAFTAWIAVAAGRHGAPARAASAGDTIPAADHPGVAHSRPAGAR
jgi:prepilin signal peptidase PulO-like enzyme (type II secretory pathway)